MKALRTTLYPDFKFLDLNCSRVSGLIKEKGRRNIKDAARIFVEEFVEFHVRMKTVTVCR